MFDNVGKVIKNCAGVAFVLVMVFSFLNAFVLSETIWELVIYIVIGIFVALIIAAVLYGFGHHIETSDAILEKLNSENFENTASNIPVTFPKEEVPKPIAQSDSGDNYDKNVTDKIIDKMIEGKKNTLQTMLNNGEITKEEFEEKLVELTKRTV